jgi:hypothetical protein
VASPLDLGDGAKDVDTQERRHLGRGITREGFELRGGEIGIVHGLDLFWIPCGYGHGHGTGGTSPTKGSGEPDKHCPM